MIFFTYFGVFAFFGVGILFVLVTRELKKELPTPEERQELIKLHLIDENCKDKKILRAYTTQLRVFKQFLNKQSQVKGK